MTGLQLDNPLHLCEENDDEVILYKYKTNLPVINR